MGRIEAAQAFIGFTQANSIESLWQLSPGWTLAQQNTDVFGNFQAALDNFIQSGQVWALLLGFFLGYFFRSLTSY